MSGSSHGALLYSSQKSIPRDVATVTNTRIKVSHNLSYFSMGSKSIDRLDFYPKHN